jgi:hypothetical protein
MTKATTQARQPEQETKQPTGFAGVFNCVAGITLEIAKPTAKAMVKLAPRLAVAGPLGLEALPFVAAAAAAGAAVGVGLQYLSRHQQANAKAKAAAP